MQNSSCFRGDGIRVEKKGGRVTEWSSLGFFEGIFARKRRAFFVVVDEEAADIVGAYLASQHGADGGGGGELYRDGGRGEGGNLGDSEGGASLGGAAGRIVGDNGGRLLPHGLVKRSA